MKFILSFLLLSGTCFILTAQTNRYYPSVKGIFNAPEDKMMSKDFDFFNNWIKKNAQYVFYKDLQTTTSPNGDASLYSLSLVFRKDAVFQFGNSGIALKIRSDSSGIAIPAVQIQQQYKILAYLRSFDPDSYDPKDLKNKFQLGLSIYNISEEQAMAQFLNNFIVVDKKHASNPLQQLSADLKQKKKIHLQFDESKDQQILKKVATQIYEQSNRYSSEMLYDLYIQSGNATLTERKFGQFFRSSTVNASEEIDEVVAYNMEANFPKKDISIQIAEKYIALFRKENETLIPEKAALTLSLKSVSLKTVHTTDQKCLKIRLVFNPDKNDNRLFKVPDILPKDKRSLYRAGTSFSVNKIDVIELKVYEDFIEADVILDEGKPMISSVPFLRQKFLLN